MLQNLSSAAVMIGALRVKDDETLDTWWSHVAETGNFPCLTKIVLAILTCLRGSK